MSAGGISLSVTGLGRAGDIGFVGRETPPRTVEPHYQRSRQDRRRAQGDGRKALRLGFPCYRHAGLADTTFGCGASHCHSCAIIADHPDGTSQTSPTCIVPAVDFNGKTIRTVEGHAKGEVRPTLQKPFIEHFAFQYGHCTASFLIEGQILLERLEKNPVAWTDLRAPSPKPSTGIFAATPATSNIMRPFAP